MLMKTLGAAKLSTKGQATIPADARRQFDLNVGDLLLFVEKDGELIIKKG
jgi:AbrB family looped-hinge helix DNA binding protein